MDLVLETCDAFLFDPIYAKLFPLPGAGAVIGTEVTSIAKNISMTFTPENPYEYTFFPAPTTAYLTTITRDNIFRQFVSLFLVTYIFGVMLYFLFASLSYVFVFDKRTFDHPRYLKNQMRLEISMAMYALPWMALFTTPWFVFEVRGYSKLYWDTQDYSKFYLIAQIPFFIAFTDALIYYIHRYLHHPRFYKSLHKPHHKWIMPTPFASHAFHPFDGYLQSLPYHFFPFLFPLHKFNYLLLFTFVNIWTVMIHDGEYLANDPVINGSACHSIHHLYFNYNYGQFTTLWDRVGGSYRQPEEEFFDKNLKMDKNTWKKTAEKSDMIMKEVEHDDDRVYSSDAQEKKSK
ncbi:uncharacterized protein V1510DRAFT_201914 [Dipodascopsis tothii]|uniref:uncharacterized protein n=1 Tax=Dipodascopsis tothii TaxID=44089 RepID=UPI0034CFA0BA